MNPVVGIVMGSDSDWPVLEQAAIALQEFGLRARRMSSRPTGCPKK
jgi:phosphoribosylcarboxyaminoimidazole (NCAIR) mutase